jgi:3-oxoacyl-(acyl-carrier-protein) synthase
MMNRRVVITGSGAVSAAGLGHAALRDGVRRGRSFITPITTFPSAGFPIRIGGQVPDFRPEEHIDRKTIVRTPRNTHLAFVAAAEALAASGLDMANEDPTMVGSVMGTTLGGSEYSEKGLTPLFTKGPGHVSPFLPTTLLYNGAMSQLSIRHNLQGCTLTVISEAAGGVEALRIAAELIAEGELDAALVGGCEATLWPGFDITFAGLGVHARQEGDPARAYRPFDRDATGLVPGEGAALLVLEAEEHAHARGATILAEVVGHGATFDAEESLSFAPDGIWYGEAMRGALAMAGIGPRDLGAVVAEGRGERRADQAEAHALVRALDGAPVPITCIKGAIGHAFATAGALDAICALDILCDGIIPPVTNLERVGVTGALDFVIGAARRVSARHVLIAARGLAGVNVAVVLRRVV